jgi:hypothetical protein
MVWKSLGVGEYELLDRVQEMIKGLIFISIELINGEVVEYLE